MTHALHYIQHFHAARMGTTKRHLLDGLLSDIHRLGGINLMIANFSEGSHEGFKESCNLTSTFTAWEMNERLFSSEWLHLSQYFHSTVQQLYHPSSTRSHHLSEIRRLNPVQFRLIPDLCSRQSHEQVLGNPKCFIGITERRFPQLPSYQNYMLRCQHFCRILVFHLAKMNFCIFSADWRRMLKQWCMDFSPAQLKVHALASSYIVVHSTQHFIFHDAWRTLRLKAIKIRK